MLLKFLVDCISHWALGADARLLTHGNYVMKYSLVLAARHFFKHTDYRLVDANTHQVGEFHKVKEVDA